MQAAATTSSLLPERLGWGPAEPWRSDLGTDETELTLRARAAAAAAAALRVVREALRALPDLHLHHHGQPGPCLCAHVRLCAA